MTFHGMDTEAGRALAERMYALNREFSDLYELHTQKLESVRWEGNDRDAVVADWNAFLQGTFAQHIQVMENHAKQMEAEVEAQDVASIPDRPR